MACMLGELEGQSSPMWDDFNLIINVMTAVGSEKETVLNCTSYMDTTLLGFQRVQ